MRKPKDIPQDVWITALALQRNLAGNRADGITDAEFDGNSETLARAILAATAKATETMRDRFAMAALTGICGNDYSLNNIIPSECADWAYQFADAMLMARQIGGAA